MVRCDRNHPFYQEEENLEKMKELLMNYVMHDFDTGYIQGSLIFLHFKENVFALRIITFNNLILYFTKA